MAPPRLVGWLLWLWLSKADRRAIASDLDELYAIRRARDGEVVARGWLRRQWAQVPRYLLFGERPQPSRDPDPRFDQPGEPMENLWRDLRLSFRSLARSPGLTATIVLTVGLGIGATTAMWSAVHRVLISPLPYAEPGRLVRIFTDSPPNRWRFSVADYLALDEQQTTFEKVAGYTAGTATYHHGEGVERVQSKIVTGDYFTLLGLRPSAGRLLGPDDDRPGGEQVVVVSDAFASRHLGGAGAAVGRTLRLNDREHEVVGVLPSDLGPLEQGRDLFLPARWETPPRKGPFFVTALGRLGRGASRETAAAELKAINRRIFPLWQVSYKDERASWGAMDLSDFVIGEIGPTLLLVLGAVGFVLLIASTNATNLLLARAAQRRRELALRGALGASRGRLVQHLMAEAAWLAAGAAALGLGIAALGIRLLSATGAAYLPRAGEIGLSGPVLTFFALVTAGSGLLFGLVPALAAARARDASALGAGGRTGTEGRGARRLRQALVSLQFAVATPLLVASALLLFSLGKLRAVDPGFDSENVLTASLLLPRERYSEAADIRDFWERTQSGLEALPGVTAVAFADGRPPRGVGNVNNFDLEDKPSPAGESEPTAPWVTVSPEYFELMGIPLLAGRAFDGRDAVPDAPEVVVVDRAWAEQHFPGQEALGRRLHEGGSATWTTVVGVVAEAKYMGLDQPDRGTVYGPMAQRSSSQPIERLSSRFAYVLLRTSSEPTTLLPAMRRVVRELDPALPLDEVATLEELVAGSLEVPRLLSLLVGAFAAAALLLSVVGIYGVMSYFVQQHARELGIRLALGGEPAAVLRLVVGRGLGLAGLGVAAGLGAALAFTRLLASLLFGVASTDGATFVGVAAAMLLVAFAACLLPARRAAGLDPATTLRAE